MDILKPTITHFADQRAPISGQINGHESNAFNINIAINPLIAAATPLLCLAKQLRKQKSCPNLVTLKNSLSHEVHAFENNAQKNGYRSATILGARYLICSLIDEIISLTAWGKQEQWTQKGLLKTFQNETWGGKRFFMIIERCSEDAIIYIDLLELSYLCLSLGYHGQFNQTHTLYKLGDFIDHLFETIQHQRGELKQQLLIENNSLAQKKPTQWHWPPVWITLLSGFLLLATIYIPYYQRIKSLTHSINYIALNHNKRESHSE